MVCKDWEKGKKIFLIICSVIVCIMLILGIIMLVVKDDKSTNNYDESLNSENLEFSGSAYSPSKIYDENNQEISLDVFSDKPMALIFFNTTNEESIDSLKMFQAHESEYSEKVNIIAICVADGITENSDTVKEKLAENSIELKNVLYDIDYTAKNEYNINTIPSFVFINKNGDVINTLENNIDEDVILANLDILAENY